MFLEIRVILVKNLRTSTTTELILRFLNETLQMFSRIVQIFFKFENIKES